MNMRNLTAAAIAFSLAFPLAAHSDEPWWQQGQLTVGERCWEDAESVTLRHPTSNAFEIEDGVVIGKRWITAVGYLLGCPANKYYPAASEYHDAAFKKCATKVQRVDRTEARWEDKMM